MIKELISIDRNEYLSIHPYFNVLKKCKNKIFKKRKNPTKTKLFGRVYWWAITDSNR